MRVKSGKQQAAAEKVVKDIRRKTRRQHSAEEKIRIVLEGLRGNFNKVRYADKPACCGSALRQAGPEGKVVLALRARPDLHCSDKQRGYHGQHDEALHRAYTP